MNYFSMQYQPFAPAVMHLLRLPSQISSYLTNGNVLWKYTSLCGVFGALTSWDWNATRRPSLAMPSSFSSLRCGHSDRQKARAIRSMSRLCSAESLALPLGWGGLCRKKTCTNKKQRSIQRQSRDEPMIERIAVLLSSGWSFRSLCILTSETSWCCWWTPWIFHRWDW